MANYDPTNTQFWRRIPTENGMKLERVFPFSDPYRSCIDFTQPIVLLLPGRFATSPNSQQFMCENVFEERKRVIAGSLKTLEVAMGSAAAQTQIISVSYHSDSEPDARIVQMRENAETYSSNEARYVYDTILAKAQNNITLVGFSYGTAFCQELANENIRLNNKAIRQNVTVLALGTLSTLHAIGRNGFPGIYIIGTNDTFIKSVLPSTSESENPFELSYLPLNDDVAIIKTPIPNTVLRLDKAFENEGILHVSDMSAHEPGSYCLAMEGSTAVIDGRSVPAYQHATYARYVLDFLACRSEQRKFQLSQIRSPRDFSRMPDLHRLDTIAASHIDKAYDRQF